jgi:hypothetical protein
MVMADHRRYTKRKYMRELAFAKGYLEALLTIEQEYGMSELEEEIDKYKNRIDVLEDRIKGLPSDPDDDK